MKHLNFSGILILLAILISGEVSLSQTCATCPGNTVTGVSASAFGAGNTASGAYSMVAGRNSFATNAYTYVLGSYSKAQGLSSVTIGNQSISTGNYSFVFGNNSVSEFDFSMALGHNLNANMGGFVLGQGRVDAVLTNNLQSTLMIGFNSQYPTLFVGRTDINNQSGRIGIGNVTSPEAKLHIRADEDEEAAIMLESFGRRSPSQRIIMTNNKDLTGWLELSVGKDDRSVLTLSNLKSERKSNMRFESQYFLFYEGAVGIGTEEPQAMLDVAGGAMVESLSIKGGYSLPTTAGNQTQFLRGDGTWAVPSGGGGGSSYWLPSGNNIYYTGGNVGIGTASTDYKLTVAGGIHAREVKVTLNAGADYVFASDYKLTPLHELENFVIANKHLPGIASETEMLEQGLDMGSFQIKLLEKIEELTLYIIQQQKDMERQQKEIEALKTAVSKP